jgi:hypothetical protein
MQNEKHKMTMIENDIVDLQIKFNQSKNLFHKNSNETLKFTKSTMTAIQNIDRIAPDDLNLLIDYTVEKVLQELCRVNQYYSFRENDKTDLKKIYWNLFQNITEKKKTIDTISQIHYENLKVWLAKTNPFSQEMYQKKEIVLEPITCEEYSEILKKNILHLKDVQLLEPILDIGCGQDGNLVKYLRKNAFEAYGIDRFADNSLFLEKADWLNFDYDIEKWGTIMSNLGFSNHFIHNHLREDGNFIGYAKKYMDILESLKIGGCFCYAPDLPFIEQYLDENIYSIKKYDIEKLSFKTTIIKRLN